MCLEVYKSLLLKIDLRSGNRETMMAIQMFRKSFRILLLKYIIVFTQIGPKHKSRRKKRLIVNEKQFSEQEIRRRDEDSVFCTLS